MTSVASLNREMYAEAEAARLLRLSQSTLHWWLEGGVRSGRSYRPVLREEATGGRQVTWGEFVEAGLLRQYRRVHQVPLHELRVVIDRLRDELGVPHPLAHARPYIGPGRKLMKKIQDEAGLGADFCLVAIAGGEMILTQPADEFVERVRWDDDLVVSWRPHDDPQSPVRMDPAVRFGLPAVEGIRTEIIWEHVEAEEAFDEIAEQFDISTASVRWALAYETSLRSKAA